MKKTYKLFSWSFTNFFTNGGPVPINHSLLLFVDKIISNLISMQKAKIPVGIAVVNIYILTYVFL